MKFKWFWCEMCEFAAIICPKCGNNTCNGGYGEVDGKPCEICSLAYQYEQLAIFSKRFPTTKELVSKYNQGE